MNLIVEDQDGNRERINVREEVEQNIFAGVLMVLICVISLILILAFGG